MDARKYIDLFVLFVQQVLQLSHFGFEGPHALLQTLGVASGEGTSAELVAGLAFEANVGALGTARSHTIAADLLASTSAVL